MDWIAKMDDDIEVNWEAVLSKFQSQELEGGGSHQQQLYCHLILRNRQTFRAGKHLDPKHQL